MKHLVLFAAFLTISVGVRAQGISAGLRTGTSYWMQKTGDKGLKLEASNSQRYTWDNELFIRLERKSRWAFEGRFAHATRRHTEYGINPPGCFGPNYGETHYTRTQRQNIYDFSLSVQYDITCKGMKSCPITKRLKSYVGLNLAPAYTAGVNTYMDEYTAPSSYNNSYFEFWTGLSHTLNYSLSPKLAVSSVIEAKAIPGRLFESFVYPNDPLFRTSLRIGLAYKL